jgi:NADPH-dependent F420 reductase
VTRVALLGGTGRIGPALALRLSAAGVEVVLGSREAEKADATATRLSERLAGVQSAPITGQTNADAVRDAGVVMVTVPFEAQAATLTPLAGALEELIVVSTAIPMRFDPDLGPEAVDVAEGSAAEQVAAVLPRSRVVGALHTVSSVHLGKLDRDLDEDTVVTSDDAGARAEVMELLELIPGLRAVDGGRLVNARATEGMTVLLLSINRMVKRSVGIRITNLPRA